MVLRCIWSIELIGVETYGKMGGKTHILGISGDLYRYTLNLYRYTLCSGHFWPKCTGTL